MAGARDWLIDAVYLNQERVDLRGLDTRSDGLPTKLKPRPDLDDVH